MVAFRSLLLSLLLALPACVGTRAEPSIAAALAELQSAPALAGARIGVMVLDAANGQPLAAAMADRGFATASNMKLLTAAVALETLGPDHRFVTELATCGAIDGGVLRGELILRGGGDPTFAETARAAEQWPVFAQALRLVGIQHVVGRLVGAADMLPKVYLGHGWQWDYLADDYAAPFAGLVAAGSALDVQVAAVDGKVQVSTTPQLSEPAQWVQSHAVTAVSDGKPSLSVQRGLGEQTIVVSGAVLDGKAPVTLRAAVADPVRFAEAVATSALRREGIQIDEKPVLLDGPEIVVATVRSPPLAEIVAPMLTRSDNLYAEMLFRMAARSAGEGAAAGGTEAAEVHAKRTLRQLGVADAGMVLADGSGLSRRNLVQPRQLAALLLAARERPWFASFFGGLPVAGRSGTLRSRFADGPARDHVHAKTGFIARVVCLSGYVERPVGRPLVFCVMLNDFVCDSDAAKAACDRFVQQLATYAGW